MNISPRENLVMAMSAVWTHRFRSGLTILGIVIGITTVVTVASLLTGLRAGVITFLILASLHGGSVGPDWGVGLALGAGGIIGGYCGARLQPRLPEDTIGRLLGGSSRLSA